MSRSYNTDPYLIRAYRLSGRKIDKDWREKWRYRNSPPYGIPEWNEWNDARPELPHAYRYYKDLKRESSKQDRAINHRRIRARERECIAHEDYDSIPKITKAWYDWWD